MKQLILTAFTCFSVLMVQAQTRLPAASSEKQLVVEQEEQLVDIYPNPTSGVFTISVPNLDAKKADLRIINVIGNEVYHETFTGNGGELKKSIDLGRYAKGLYYVKFETDNGLAVVRRLVIK